ncbi:MAG TPA: hypothetical protein VFU23_03485 [Gemmatimonadales bacterium]|nr:hypothetical protein [Gemmatimonadales bacterium]
MAGSESAPAVVRDAGFAALSAVIHDPDLERYLIANVNGAPGVADGNGYISMLSPAGTVLQLKWIDGASADVNLSSPAGMAVAGEYFFVADISTIRRFDRRDGTPKGEIPIPGAVALDGMCTSLDGSLYFTDSGDSAHAGAIYRLGQDSKLDTLARGPDLGHPTGIAVTGDSVYVVSREGEMYRVAGGKRLDVVKLPGAGLEGLVIFAGDAFVSSADGRALFRGKFGGPFAALLENVESPGGIGHDIWRNRILVPLFRSNELRILRLAF